MKPNAHILRIGDAVFDPSTRRLCGRRGERRLSPKATGVLLALAETPGEVWTRDALLERVWPDVTVGEEVLTHAVAELRRAIGDDFRNPTAIETIHKSGYRLILEILADDPNRLTVHAHELGVLGTDLDTYGEYLQASVLFDRAGPRNWARALELFGSSIERDPTFAPAYAGVAKTMLFFDQYSSARAGSLELVLQHCSVAQRLDPQHGEAFAVEAMAYAMQGNATRARQLFSKAVRLAPNSHEVHELLGRACFAHLDPRLAPVMFERAAALCPDDFKSANLAGTACVMIGDRDRAAAYFALALRRTDSCLEIYPNDFIALSNRAHSLFHLGREGEASVALEPVCSHPEPVRHGPACVLALAGEFHRAMDVLERSIDEGWHYSAWLARDPCLSSMRGTPRFKRIARLIGAH